jgi:hypothetical protein
VDRRPRRGFQTTSYRIELNRAKAPSAIEVPSCKALRDDAGDSDAEVSQVALDVQQGTAAVAPAGAASDARFGHDRERIDDATEGEDHARMAALVVRDALACRERAPCPPSIP